MAARLLRSWVRIPLVAWMFVCCECCVLSGRGLCNELIAHPEESYWLWCIILCDLETSRMRRPWPTLGCSATGKNKKKGIMLIVPFIYRFSPCGLWHHALCCVLPPFQKNWVLPFSEHLLKAKNSQSYNLEEHNLYLHHYGSLVSEKNFVNLPVMV